jgi:hypothetical protein
MSKRRDKRAEDRVTQAQALAASAFAAMVTQFPPAWAPDFLAAVEKQTVHDEPLRGAERRALDQALSSCSRLFEVLGVPFQTGDEVVVTRIAAQGLAFLHAHVLPSPPDSDLLI